MPRQGSVAVTHHTSFSRVTLWHCASDGGSSWAGKPIPGGKACSSMAKPALCSVSTVSAALTPPTQDFVLLLKARWFPYFVKHMLSDRSSAFSERLSVFCWRIQRAWSWGSWTWNISSDHWEKYFFLTYFLKFSLNRPCMLCPPLLLHLCATHQSSRFTANLKSKPFLFFLNSLLFWPVLHGKY